MNKSLAPALVCFLLAGPAHGQAALEEVVVTGSFAAQETTGTHLRRRGDNLLLKVKVLNDSREQDQREREIYESLDKALDAAGRESSIELSTVSDAGFVNRLTKSNYQVDLAQGNRPDTSVAWFRAMSPITAADQDGEALVRRLKRFIEGLKPTGRTEFIVEGDVEISVVEPDQYRKEVIKLLAADVTAATSALGEDYRVIVTGMDKPVQWARAGSLEVALFIPYSYVVVPTTINAYTSITPDY